jgi:DNA processing protein
MTSTRPRRPSDDIDFIALSLLPVLCWPEVAERLRAGQPPAAVLDGLTATRWPGDPQMRADVMTRARAAAARADAGRMNLVTWAGASYPVALAAIHDPPPALWVRGRVEALAGPAVAIVGSRAGSAYALEVAGRLAADLVERGVVIVSGLARGVDSAAHRGALSRRGVTVAVLGSGADVVYPPEHRALAAEIESRNGAVVSEMAPGTPPLPWLFPQRNRVISGLSRAVVVIEAGEKSGSLITARMALEQGRDVLAVPGNVLSGRNRGAHALLRDGAKIVESADDILDELGMARAEVSGSAQLEADPVLACLVPGEACDLDELAARTGLEAPRLLARLLDLQLLGIVSRSGAGRFVRFDRPCYGGKNRVEG